MLALIDYRYVRFRPFRRAPVVWYDTVFGMRVVRLTAEISRRNGRCKKSVKALSKMSADMVCFSDGFPVRGHFGVREPAFSIAYERLLPQIIEQHDFEGKTALLVAGADPHSVELLRVLARRYRYVLTSGVPRVELERLQRVFGASVISEPSLERIADAELAVLLRQPLMSELPPQCVVIAANLQYLENISYSRYIALPELDAPGPSPEGFDRRVLLSEALRRGALPYSRLMPQNTQILTK